MKKLKHEAELIKEAIPPGIDTPGFPRR